jgi:cell division protein FtsI (penicillin-binding protein 3)
MARARAGNRRVGMVRRGTLLMGILTASLLVALRVLQVGVVQGPQWAARADDQHVEIMTLPAPRGTIYDRNGVPLAASRERYSIGVAPREVREDERDRLVELLRTKAGLPVADARRAVNTRLRWVVLRGRHDEPVRDALDEIRGVHFQPVLQRFYPHAGLAAHLLGAVDYDGLAQSGLELEFDSVLIGRPGSATVRRDSRGRPIPGVMLRTAEPEAGRDLVLTIDQALQQIADDALREALVTTRASGGEILLTDPRTGEILAAASYKQGRPATSWSALTVPYEPGSILKPFTVAALLAENKAELADSLWGENGQWRAFGRVLTDVHAFGWLTLEEALRESSNIGIAKAAARLDPATQYGYLRDFGFGTPTGVTYPSESGGSLRRPVRWSRQSPASLAIGYEISATPLQLAMAYGALANGGLLMEPRIVREVRARDGRTLRTREPRVIRRVVPAPITAELRRVLGDVVEQGTGRQASMGPLKVAGKTGTARVAVAGRYLRGEYDATFAGFFPADDPQLVFIVKVERPRGAYYGGATAAPVTRATLEAALAARSEPLGNGVLAKDAAADADASPGAPVRAELESRRANAAGPFTFTLDGGAVRDSASSRRRTDGMPDVAGLPMRDAVSRIHAAGFTVEIQGSGRVVRTVPAAGASPGGARTVRLVGRDGGR